jgi:hypothetical protein
MRENHTLAALGGQSDLQSGKPAALEQQKAQPTRAALTPGMKKLLIHTCFNVVPFQ